MITDRELFDTCVFGGVSLIRAVLPHMIDRNSGVIAVLSCVEAALAAPFAGTLSGYKHALDGYFKSLRHEVVGFGISVSTIVLGPVDMTVPERVSRMSYLCLVSMMNNLHYSWVCRYPFLTIMYVQHYFPDMC